MRYVLFIALFYSLPALADTPPVPAEKDINLKTIERTLDYKQDQKDKLEKTIVLDKSQLKSLQKQMVEIAEDIQNNEKSLSETEKEETRLSAEKQDLERNIEQDKAQIASLVGGLVHLSQTPKAAYISNLDSPEKMVITEAALSHYFPPFMARIEQFSKKIEDLNTVQSQLEQKQKQLAAEKEQLKTQRGKLGKLIVQREASFQQHKGLLTQYEKQIEQYAKQAKDMKDFIRKLSVEKPPIPQRRSTTRTAVKPMQRSMDLPSRGSKRLPVAGTLSVAFGANDSIGAQSEGIKIQARPDATVVAPMGGIVRYIGSFKAYKNLVIIEHENNYHSLIAGVDNISVSLEQKVMSGEPIGQLGHGQSGSALLYYELRHKGQPINPI